jgi:very-short-patch-repair endonuclease
MKFLRQKPIHLMNEGSGRERYIIPDFYCFEKNIIIEVDGNVHENREVAELDVEKEKLLRVQ